MIPVVEDYLSELLERKLTFLVKNPTYYKRILGTSEVRINKLEKFLATTPVKIIKGYPREPSQLPCICILLSGEEETQEALGNVDEYFQERGTIESHRVVENEPAVLKATASGSLFAEVLEPIIAIIGVSFKDKHGNLVALPEGEFFVNPSFPYQVELCTPELLDVGDTVYLTYKYASINDEAFTRYLFESNYRIEAWANNGDLVVDLYHLAKWALLSGRDYLASEKLLFQQKVTGADFQPAPNFFPEFVYRRALSFWCQHSILPISSDDIEGGQYIEDIVVTQHLYEI